MKFPFDSLLVNLGYIATEASTNVAQLDPTVMANRETNPSMQVAILTDKADLNKEHDAIVTLPWKKDEKFLFRVTYDQIYGPFKKGTRIWFLVDTPHLDTYDVQLWISHERKDFQLACAGKNQIDMILP